MENIQVMLAGGDDDESERTFMLLFICLIIFQSFSLGFWGAEGWFAEYSSVLCCQFDCECVLLGNGLVESETIEHTNYDGE